MTATLNYVFDPLCGWCYGASATISRLSDNPGVQLNLVPSGLFSGSGSRPMDDEFAAYAWSNDQRIGRLSGQPFSDRYRSEVLADRQQMLDSGPATVALTAVAQTAPERELEALLALQRARYVQGLDVTLLDTLRGVLRTLGLEQAATLLEKPDATLLEATRRRMAHAQTLLAEFGARGVPTLILDQGGDRKLLDASSMYSNPQAFVDQFTAA